MGEQYICDPTFDMLELPDELVYTLDGHKTVFNQSKENNEGYNSHNLKALDIYVNDSTQF